LDFLFHRIGLIRAHPCDPWLETLEEILTTMGVQIIGDSSVMTGFRQANSHSKNILIISVSNDLSASLNLPGSKRLRRKEARMWVE